MFHHLNAYEVTRPDGAPGHLVLDVLPMPSVDFSKTNDDINMERYRDADNKAQLWRYAIDMRSGGATVQRAKLAENWSEMPTGEEGKGAGEAEGKRVLPLQAGDFTTGRPSGTSMFSVITVASGTRRWTVCLCPHLLALRPTQCDR